MKRNRLLPLSLCSRVCRFDREMGKMKIDKPDPGNSGTDFQHPKWCGYSDFHSGWCKYWIGFGEALGILHTGVSWTSDIISYNLKAVSGSCYNTNLVLIYTTYFLVPWPKDGEWHPIPVLLPGKSHGRRSLVGCSPWGRWELDTTQWLHFHALEKEMAIHSSVLAWRIPGMAEPVGCCLWGRTESDTTEVT